MKAKDEIYEEDNNVKIYFNNGTNMGMTLNTYAFRKWLDEKHKFYHLLDENNNLIISINKDEITHINYKIEGEKQ